MTRKQNISVIAPSPYPAYTSPLVVQGNAVILPDLEAPFQNSEFVNKVMRLAAAWHIPNLVLAGDAVHWASLSSWTANWKSNAPSHYDDEILAFMKGLDEESKKRGIQLLEQMGIIREDESVSGELATVRQTLRCFNSQFQSIYWILGNHEDRLLRKLQASLSTADLLFLVSAGDKWQSAPYYWCNVFSGGEMFRVSHPRGSANIQAKQIAIRHHCHAIIGHSHKWLMEHDPSGQYWAIHAGHCVDEERLAYAAQRDGGGYDAHCLGAVIIADGFPWLLADNSPFEELATLRKYNGNK